MAKRSYSDREKAEALAALDANGGNLARTARETSVPRATLKGWKDGQGIGTEVSDIRHQKRADLSVLWETVVEKALGLLPNKLSELTGDQLARVAGIGSDKLIALREADMGCMDDNDEQDEEYRPEQIEALVQLVRAEAHDEVHDA